MDRQKVIDGMKDKLDQWSTDIDALEKKASRVSDEKREEFRAAVADLKDRRAKAEGEMERLKDAAGDSFQDMSRGLEKAWDSLSSSIKDARQRYS